MSRLARLIKSSTPNFLLEFLREQARIFWPHPERDDSSCIADDDVTDVRLKLMQMLVGEQEPYAVFAQLAHHVSEHILDWRTGFSPEACRLAVFPVAIPSIDDAQARKRCIVHFASHRVTVDGLIAPQCVDSLWPKLSVNRARVIPEVMEL